MHRFMAVSIPSMSGGRRLSSDLWDSSTMTVSSSIRRPS